MSNFSKSPTTPVLQFKPNAGYIMPSDAQNVLIDAYYGLKAFYNVLNCTGRDFDPISPDDRYGLAYMLGLMVEKLDFVNSSIYGLSSAAIAPYLKEADHED